MSDSATLARPTASRRDTQRYGAIVVVGGGCYGSYYVRQLLRARAAAALTYERLIVVDCDAACRVAIEHAADAEVAVAEWSTFFAGYFERAAADGAEADAIVPSPLMPHLMFEWLLARARDRWPARAVRQEPLALAPGTPWQQAAPDGTHYVSFAEWMCPINCIEPARCPHTRGARDWSMPVAVRDYAAAESAAGRPLAGPAIFHCSHRAYGVGMFDTRDVLAADALVTAAAERSAARVLVATASHCHGAMSVLSIGDYSDSSDV